MDRHLYEDGFVMLLEDGGQMLLEEVGDGWEETTPPAGEWVETES